jgi:DNA-binding response OmpR family regulator
MPRARPGFPEQSGAWSTIATPVASASLPVLLVEHYLPLAKPLLCGLEEDGIVTHLARNDLEADALARAVCYAAVVVDWHIPRRGGLALVRGWRQAGLAVPVLLLVPSAPDALQQGLDAGADSFLSLPFSYEDLLSRLRSWIDRRGKAD